MNYKVLNPLLNTLVQHILQNHEDKDNQYADYQGVLVYQEFLVVEDVFVE